MMIIFLDVECLDVAYDANVECLSRNMRCLRVILRVLQEVPDHLRVSALQNLFHHDLVERKYSSIVRSILALINGDGLVVVNAREKLMEALVELYPPELCLW